MKSFPALMFTVLLIAGPLEVFSADCSSAPRIPSYLGRGYDVVFGNPSTDSVDPGFRYDVIVFDYKTGATTEDKASPYLMESHLKKLSHALIVHKLASLGGLNPIKMISKST